MEMIEILRPLQTPYLWCISSREASQTLENRQALRLPEDFSDTSIRPTLLKSSGFTKVSYKYSDFAKISGCLKTNVIIGFQAFIEIDYTKSANNGVDR